MANLHNLNRDQAEQFAGLALAGISREYPNKPDHVLNGPGDVRGPRQLHPAFFGCFDWHSAVHGHWMLVRLLRVVTGLPREAEIRAALDANLTAENLAAETAYLHAPNRQSFERTYGWGWLLKLAQELNQWDDGDALRWRRNLQPLTEAVVARYCDFLPKQNYPIRTGVHPNTAFGLAFALDYARADGNDRFENLLIERSRTYYGQDRDYPATWEPGGEDFFSPCLMEADLMRRILAPGEFSDWFGAFLPDAAGELPTSLFQPAQVTDRSDPKLGHLDGLNLSRAWCMRNIAAALPESNIARRVLTVSADRHAEAALSHVATGDYMGEHWLASFAVFLLSPA